MERRYPVIERRTFDGRVFRATTNGAGACVFLPTDGALDAVADSKSSAVLRVPAHALVTFAQR